MRARLGSMAPGEEFVFICAEDIAGKMDRVILFRGGEVVAKEPGLEGTVVRVRKKSEDAPDPNL